MGEFWQPPFLDANASKELGSRKNAALVDTGTSGLRRRRPGAWQCWPNLRPAPSSLRFQLGWNGGKTALDGTSLHFFPATSITPLFYNAAA